MTSEEIIAALPGKTGLLAMGGDPMTAKVLEAGKDLKIVANNAVGFNNIDLAAATRLKIAATNTPDVLTDTTADLAFSLILGVARRIAEADRFVPGGQMGGMDPGPDDRGGCPRENPGDHRTGKNRLGCVPAGARVQHEGRVTTTSGAWTRP